MENMYVRPVFPPAVFRDSAGSVVEYGAQWRQRDVPEEAYSRVSHPERFAGIHQVADALVDHVLATYDCTRQDGPDLVPQQGGVANPRVQTVRVVKLVPAHSDAAALVIEYLDFPSVRVHVGLLHSFPAPNCDCDACDETLDSAAGELEQVILAVVAGGFRESITEGRTPNVHMSLVFPGGSSTSEGPLRFSSLPRERVEEAQVRFGTLPYGWQPWPVRASSPASN
ncbi:hypothetical protein ART_1009 [Arthrobacter sp. PAMC 25486]|uniref:DUF6226 family protein n=1 Tax=Arthrobacter sp. PAMC 25486 TaxID=1494608 RepID=UPI00053624C5|nr:DUF6226 family protein [Arthrobacter sp. PAMC 25486]AIY00608.1 hypothetical protein ART_1009 [Arthrobacter sp. PAMC 25486]